MTAAQAKQPGLDAPASEWLVYADALQEARDPRGELIVLNHAVESGKTPAEDRDAYVAKHFEGLIGKDGKAADYRLRWRHCFVDSADVLLTKENNNTSAAVIDALCSSPAAAHVRSISLVGVGEGASRITLPIEALAAKLPKTCTSVSLIDDRAEKTTMLVSRDFDPSPNFVQVGSLDPLFALPTLEKLHLCVADAEQATPTSISAPHLKSFTFHCLRFGVDPYNNDAPRITNVLTSATWPKLEDLEVRLTETWMANIIDDAGAYEETYTNDEDFEDRMDEAEEGENEGVNWNQLNGLLQNLKKCPLKRLALTSVDSARTLLATIAETGLPGTLEELDLSDSSVADAEWFKTNKEIIKPLKRLILQRTTMSDDDAKSIASLGPEIKHSHAANGARYRYVVGSE